MSPALAGGSGAGILGLDTPRTTTALGFQGIAALSVVLHRNVWCEHVWVSHGTGIWFSGAHINDSCPGCGQESNNSTGTRRQGRTAAHSGWGLEVPALALGSPYRQQPLAK